jgi:outer membrane protein TolC
MFASLFVVLLLQSAPLPPLDLDDLVQRAERNNRELQMARRNWEAAQARPSQESAPPNPVVSLRVVGPGFFSMPPLGVGFDQQSTIAPMVMQDIPFPGKLKLKGEIAQKEADSTGRMYEATRLNVIYELKMAYFEMYKAEKSIETVGKNRELLNQFAEVARARYEVGTGIQQEVIKAQLEATMLEERLTIFRQKRDSMKAKINQLINQSPDAPLGNRRDRTIRVAPIARTTLRDDGRSQSDSRLTPSDGGPERAQAGSGKESLLSGLQCSRRLYVHGNGTEPLGYQRRRFDSILLLEERTKRGRRSRSGTPGLG